MNDWYQEGRAYKLFDDENRVLRLENTASIDQYPKQLIVCAGPTRRLRLAAAERRLEAHQQAFSLWRKLVSNVHSESQRAVVSECYLWWENNCIYLGSAAREAFSDAYLAANIHPSLLKDPKNLEAINKNWDKIMIAGSKIVEGADLPALGEREAHVPGKPTPKADPGRE